MTSAPYGVAAVIAVVFATVVVGLFGLRLSRTTSDFLVASRGVGPLWNASAVGGEYLSAASFLGVAGLILIYGADALWYPVGFAAGYLVLLLFVAAPLRRSGAYTLPDFAEARLGSPLLRRVCGVLALAVGWLYLLPQLQGAGLTLRLITGAPVWAGGAVVAVVVSTTVAAGGMRSTTYVQAFQYWLKVLAILVPAIVILLAWRAATGAGGSVIPAITGPAPPTVSAETTVRVRTDVTLVVAAPTPVALDGAPVTLAAGQVQLRAGSVVVLPAGTPVPHVTAYDAATGASWAQPLSGAGGRAHPLYATYAVVLATCLGTMGLPHVLVRFYANPDGTAARRTTLVVLALLGLFYVAPPVYGALGRLYAPDLLFTGQTDAVVLTLPTRAVAGTAGQLLGGLTVAGAFAAFLSTSTGLVVSIAGTLSQDLFRTPHRSGVSRFRVATVAGVLAPLLVSLWLLQLPAGVVVTLAFTLAASTFCPLLLLGIWWRGLTTPGALAGLGVGGSLAGGAALLTVAGIQPGGWPAALLAEPAAWTVPLAFAAALIGSWVTRERIPPDIGRTMLRLHAPEQPLAAP